VAVSAIERVLGKLDATPSGRDEWKALCPAHEDRNPSLAIRLADDGRVLLHCHAGCPKGEVVSAMGLEWRDLFERNGGYAQRRILATYDYTDEHGELLFQVVRFEPKDFRQRQPDGSGGWTWKLTGIRRVPFALPRVLEVAKAGGKLAVVEGEKDCIALGQHGLVATCNPGGAGKWRDEYSRYLLGAKVVAVITDRDEAGRSHALEVARSLALAGVEEVRLLEPPSAKDVSAHLASGGALSELRPADFPCPTCGRALE
jgi:putative DNA primase/helicase